MKLGIRAHARTLMHAAGGLVSVVAVVWLVWRLSSLLSGELAAAISELGSASLFAAFGFVCVSVLGLACGWVSLLELLEGRPVARSTLFSLYLRTQIGKYLPGNVFHYVLRQMMGRRAGLSHATLVQSAVSEAAILAVLAVLISSPLLASLATEVLPGRSLWLAVAAGGGVVAIAGALMIWRRRGGEARTRVAPRLVAPLLLGHALFFLGGAASLWFCLPRSSSTDGFAHAGLACGAWASAWLLGFVTPGSPGGIGVRESVLVALLRTEMTESQALIVALVVRVLTVAADGFLSAITYVRPLNRMLRLPDAREVRPIQPESEVKRGAAQAGSPQAGAGL